LARSRCQYFLVFFSKNIRFSENNRFDHISFRENTLFNFFYLYLWNYYEKIS
jgi:hypothetical protein